MAYDMTIKVTTEELTNQAQQVQTAANDLKECFDNLKQLVIGTSRFWQGEAGDTHREGFAKQHSDLDEIVSRYQEHVRDLQTMAGVYQEAEAAAQSAVDELPPMTF